MECYGVRDTRGMNGAVPFNAAHLEHVSVFHRPGLVLESGTLKATTPLTLEKVWSENISPDVVMCESVMSK